MILDIDFAAPTESEFGYDESDLPVGERLPHVLLAESDEALRELLHDTMARAGYEVITVEDGPELLSLLEDERYADDLDLVVTEADLPGLPGVEVLERMRGRRWSLPFLVLVGAGDREAAETAAGLGARRLAKPFGGPELLEQLRAALPYWEPYSWPAA